MYQDTSGSAAGMLSKKALGNVIKLEQEVLRYRKKSTTFKNKKFKGTEVAWEDLCYAGLDAETDPRTGKSACLGNGMSYASAVSLFTD